MSVFFCDKTVLPKVFSKTESKFHGKRKFLCFLSFGCLMVMIVWGKTAYNQVDRCGSVAVFSGKIFSHPL